MRICILVFAIAAPTAIPTASGAERVALEVRETAGIERFHYPTTADVRLPAGVPADAHFRLRDGERAVAVQITPLAEDVNAPTRRRSLDFGIDLAPNETRKLVLEYGEGVPAPSPPKRGLQVERADGLIHVRHPALEFVVPENLAGLFQSIRVSRDAWLAPKPAAGLALATRSGNRVEVRKVDSIRVTKSGPLAAALEITGSAELPEHERVAWTARLDFPLGKSWAKVDWTLDDPKNLVAGASAELQFRLEADGKPPVMADVGAAGWTYATLAPGQSLRYRASGQDEWIVERGRENKWGAYAAPPPGGPSLAPEGWAHLMDAKRATAIAMHNFARNSADTIEMGSDGKLRLAREFPAGARPPREKRLTFWLHVVASPPQWGAATSPQSMLAPPEVRAVMPDGSSESSR